MPTTECFNCGSSYTWRWEEAFEKFGFNDGDGDVETYTVEEALTSVGYSVETNHWGMHNVIITSIKLNGIEQIPESAEVGYDDPREYLPPSIVELLDTKLP